MKERFSIAVSDEVETQPRMHQSMELLFVLEGGMNVCVEKRISSLKENDVLVINANRSHYCQKTGEVLYLRLMISQQTVSEALQNSDVIFWCDSSENEDDKIHDLRKLLRSMLGHYVEQKEYLTGFTFASDTYAVLDYLTQNYLISSKEQKGAEDSERYEDRIQQINNYIYSNYDQQISMKELSEKLFLSNGYLSRFFKKNYGMNFASYLTNVRLFYAVDDLLYTDAPITRIAYKNGFTSAALFNKVFKKEYGQTPTDFRRKESRKKEAELIQHQKDLDERLGKMLDLTDTESEDRVSMVKRSQGDYSAVDYKELPPYWNTVINLGDASNLLHSSIKEHLLLLRDGLNFRYIRFWNLFSEHFYIRPDQDEYNFSNIDAVLDLVLEMGFKPFIDFGLKPSQFVYGIGHYPEGPERKTRKMDGYTVEQWQKLMQSFMTHIGNRYGQSATDDWIMELWYDEDWRRESGKNSLYLELFDITFRIIKEFNRRIRVGGYGIRMDMGEAERLDFLKKWSRLQCRPDFISAGYYAYVRGEDGVDIYARRSTDHDALLHMVLRERRILSEAGMEDIPFLLDDWNLTPSVRNYINDSTFKGAYILKNVIDMCGVVDGMGYGAGSDRQFISFDTTGELFGGTGLISRSGIMKPAAFAFDFLNRLFPYYIGKTGNFLITTDGHDNYGIVCHNQQVLNYNYYLTQEWELDRSDLRKYFEERKKLHIQIRLRDVADGSYRLKIYRISEKYGSVLQIWKDLEYERELSRNDIKYIRRACEPNLTMRKIRAEHGEIVLDEELDPDEITFIRIRRRHDE